MDKRHYAGIEVSAQRLLVGLQADRATPARREFANTPEGHEALVRWLAAAGRPRRVVMEATGLYGLDLALRLERESSLELMVANPRAVRHFAQALMKRSKNDPIDVQVLVEFAQRMPFQRWVRPSQAALHLHALARRLEALGDMHAAEKNRLHAAQLSEACPEDVQRDLKRSLRAELKPATLPQASNRMVERERAVTTEQPPLSDEGPLPAGIAGKQERVIFSESCVNMSLAASSL